MKKILFSVLAVILILASTNQILSREIQPLLRKELIKLNYAEPMVLQQLLKPFFSENGEMRYSGSSVMITISDYPENVERILKLIAEIDVKPADLLFTVQLIQGFEAGAEQPDQELQNDPIIKELKNLLKYKCFKLLDKNLLRTLDNAKASIRFGKDSDLKLTVQPRYAKGEKEETITTPVRLDFTTSQEIQEKEGDTSKSASEERRLIDTIISLKPEEKTVVGVSKLDGGNTGLILIITGKVIK